MPPAPQANASDNASNASAAQTVAVIRWNSPTLDGSASTAAKASTPASPTSAPARTPPLTATAASPAP